MPSEERVVTVPNLVSVVRLGCVPLFLWLLFARHDRAAAAVLLGALGATDWVDGYVARRWDQVSTVGKVLDPVADRILLGVAVVSILVDGSVPTLVAWAVIVREVLVSAAVLVLAALGARRIDVQWAGKAGTFGLMVTLPMFLLSHARSFSGRHLAGAAAWAIAVPALCLAWYAAVTYVPRAWGAVIETRVGSAA